ncbi:MAG: alpha/beta hydrolase-fold protein, partial [Rhodothermales bacterium]
MTTLDQTVAPSPFSPFHLANFETKEILSSSTGQAYQVRVQLPTSYRTTDQTYPVLYALDAEFLFGMQTQIPFVLNFGAVVPEFIIVGPAYGASTLQELLA